MTGASRRRWLLRAAGLAGAGLLPACSNEPLTRLSGLAFGAPGELVLWGPTPDQADRIGQQAWQTLAAFDRDWLAAPAQVAQRLAAALVAGSNTPGLPTPLAQGGGRDIVWRALGLETAAAGLVLPDPGGALLTLGQHLLALGERGYRPWHVGIPDPADGRALLGFDLYASERLVTVAHYARYRQAGATDPSGVAADRGAGECASCSVVLRAASAPRAAAIATQLYASAQADWPARAAALGADAVLWISHSGAIEASNTLGSRAVLHDQRRRISRR